jgi:hypothetical protein
MTKIMSAGPHSFRYTEFSRLLKAVKGAGFKVKGMTPRDGTPYVEIDHGDAASDDDKRNPLDRVLDDQNKKRTA